MGSAEKPQVGLSALAGILCSLATKHARLCWVLDAGDLGVRVAVTRYTLDSTGRPREVVVRNRHLLHCQEQIWPAFLLWDAGADGLVFGEDRPTSRAVHLPRLPPLRQAPGPALVQGLPHPVRERDPTRIATVVYIPGSSDRPNKLMAPHGGVTVLEAWQGQKSTRDPGSGVTHLAGLAFDAAAWEVWTALVYRSTLEIRGEGERTYQEHLSALLQRLESVWSWVPTALMEILPAQGNRLPRSGRWTGGHRQRRRRGQDGRQLFSAYDPTEMTLVAPAGPVVVPEAGGESVLTGWVAEEVAKVAVREWAAEPLPPGLWNAAYVPLERLPLKRNGKVDRDVVPLPDFGRRLSRDLFENQLVALWNRVLGRLAGLETDLFAAAGSFLTAFPVATQMASILGRAAPVKVAVRARTPIARASGLRHDDPTPLPVVALTKGEALPLFQAPRPGRGIADHLPLADQLGETVLELVHPWLTDAEADRHHDLPDAWCRRVSPSKSRSRRLIILAFWPTMPSMASPRPCSACSPFLIHWKDLGGFEHVAKKIVPSRAAHLGSRDSPHSGLGACGGRGECGDHRLGVRCHRRRSSGHLGHLATGVGRRTHDEHRSSR